MNLRRVTLALTVSQKDLHEAFKEIQKTLKNASFHAEDRKAVEQDIQRYKAIEQSRRPNRRYPRRRVIYPVA